MKAVRKMLIGGVRIKSGCDIRGRLVFAVDYQEVVSVPIQTGTRQTIFMFEKEVIVRAKQDYRAVLELWNDLEIINPVTISIALLDPLQGVHDSKKVKTK